MKNESMQVLIVFDSNLLAHSHVLSNFFDGLSVSVVDLSCNARTTSRLLHRGLGKKDVLSLANP